MEKTKAKNKIDRMVAALLEHGSQERAAAALNISPVTIWRWSRKPEFQQAYDDARREAYSRAMARAQYSSNRAISTLLQVMLLKDVSPASRVRAADALLDHAGGAYAVDLARRITQLEDRTDDSEKA